MKRLTQTGDTLVEVMVALAIIGSVLAICYASASRSLNVGRQAQERTEALKLAEAQVELLKARAPDDALLPLSDSNSIFHNGYDRTPPGPVRSFCLSQTGLFSQQMIALDMLGTSGDSLLHSTDPGIAGGSPVGAQIYHYYCAVGVDQRYNLSIESLSIQPGNRYTYTTFFVRARWERLGGGKDEVRVVYRISREQF